MQWIDLPLVTFVLVTTFTPGPNNISSAAMGVLQGYRKTLDYLAGISLGFFIMMLLSAWASGWVLGAFPALESLLRYVGATYILYLAYATLKASYSFEGEGVRVLGFRNGMLLQVLNPKLIFYGLTLFATFLAPVTSQPGQLLVAAFLLTFTAFCAISVWALFGTLIKRTLHRPKARLAVNIVLSLLLVFTALELAGLF